MRHAALAIFLLLLCSLPLASVQWSYSAQGPIIGKPVLSSGNAVFPTYAGKVYSFSSSRGTISWVYDADSGITVPIAEAAPGAIAVASGSGKLAFINAAGKETASVQLPSPVLYLAGGAGEAFVSLGDGVQAYSPHGDSLWNFTLSGPAGPIGVSGSAVYFTSGGKLYSLSAGDGSQNFAVDAQDSFMSAPVEYDGSVYFGATDGSLYAFDAISGRQRWHYQTGGWVQSTPVASGDSVFFGSDDGYFYSVTASGKLRYRFKTGEGAWSEPVLYPGNGGQQVVFGSNDGNIYGLDASSGKQVWSFTAGGRLGSAVESGGALFFGTSAGKFYALSPSPICSFSWPSSGALVGDWPVDIYGTSYSDSGVSGVEIRIEGGNWQSASGGAGWHSQADFTGKPFGAYTVECRVTDSSGAQQAGDYSAITLVKGQNVPLGQISVYSPSEAGMNETISISARDSRGMELTGVNLSVSGQTRTGDSPFSVVLGKSGAVPIRIEKPGFEPVSFAIIGTGGDSLLIPIIALVVLCALAFFAYRKFIAKK